MLINPSLKGGLEYVIQSGYFSFKAIIKCTSLICWSHEKIKLLARPTYLINTHQLVIYFSRYPLCSTLLRRTTCANFQTSRSTIFSCHTRIKSLHFSVYLQSSAHQKANRQSSLSDYHLVNVAGIWV